MSKLAKCEVPAVRVVNDSAQEASEKAKHEFRRASDAVLRQPGLSISLLEPVGDGGGG